MYKSQHVLKYLINCQSDACNDACMFLVEHKISLELWGVTHKSMIFGFGLRHMRVSHLVLSSHTLEYHTWSRVPTMELGFDKIINRYPTDSSLSEGPKAPVCPLSVP